MFNLFRLCWKDEISFDIIAETGNIVAKNGNNVEATFNIVERIVQLVAFDSVASTLLLVWTGLKACACYFRHALRDEPAIGWRNFTRHAESPMQRSVLAVRHHSPPKKNCFIPWRSTRYMVYGSLGSPESASQTASRSVQPYLQGSWTCPTDRQTTLYCVCSSRPLSQHVVVVERTD